jgi:hypothetical protein
MIVQNNYIFGRKYGTNLLNNLVGYYPFNSNANDLSGKGYNGTAIAVSPVTYVTGKVGNAINFVNDATPRYVDIADNNDFSFTNGTTDVPFTISLWVNLTSFSSTGNWFISKRGLTSGTDEWQFVFSGGRVIFNKFQFNNNSIFQNIQSSLNPFLLNTWYHICYTDNGSGAIGSGKIYINGSLNAPINANSGGTYTRMNNGTNFTRIGMNSWTPVENLKHRGLIDEVAIWKNRELNATEVAELYTKGNLGNPII